jgi:hypothetical protein
MNAASNYSVIKADSWDEFKQIIESFSENWVFRGQINCNWVLKNAIERTDFIHHSKGIETLFVTEFQRGARNYLNRNELPEHLIEWLALMQHHGAPTRLLDFSKSPFISAYFAFEQCSLKIDSVAVWAINIHYIRNAAVDLLRTQFEEDFEQSNNHINENIFEKIFHSNEHSVVFPVEPFRMNRRYSLQQSIFVSTGNSFEPFMQQLNFLGNDAAKAVARIEIPTSEQKTALRNLLKMNIHRASLFPDIDGYALSMKLKYNSMKTAEEAFQQQIALLNDDSFKLLP